MDQINLTLPGPTGERERKRFLSGPEGLRGSGESAGRRRKSRSAEKACGWVEHEKSVVLRNRVRGTDFLGGQRKGGLKLDKQGSSWGRNGGQIQSAFLCSYNVTRFLSQNLQ